MSATLTTTSRPSSRTNPTAWIAASTCGESLRRSAAESSTKKRRPPSSPGNGMMLSTPRFTEITPMSFRNADRPAWLTRGSREELSGKIGDLRDDVPGEPNGLRERLRERQRGRRARDLRQLDAERALVLGWLRSRDDDER